ncbi:ATP-binding cassette domain-containing protein [Lactobacillus helveticus]|uniref:ABC transporter n=2 Tax=Lactobacillus helveticus TaxID=1587 RepID=A0A9Q5C912_LACHE|nr:ABC transporter ATP-binding protein [Lactobacillus helveticus]AJY62152.1 ABC transporter [Lactobacillus helveticus]ALI53306.1 ABC transporter [Lactobacillus helveticus]MBU5981339.1 ABC transporter ATP-binding protein/permease [Lactobacillus helveticus]MCT3414036.1 ABC transporter ATP-binding protein [Lactobacillus helveticus]NRN90163.1 Protein glycosylation K [Lactobacillus helveticus]
MALQYVEIRYRFLFLVISFFKSLQVVFIAIISQQMINWISRPQLNQLLGLVMIAFLGLIIFWIIGVGYQKIYFTVVQKINYNIKAITGKYLIFNARPYVKVNTSFFTNDLKSIETNRVEAELQILTNGIQFGTAVISAIVGSLSLTIIFMVASFLPGILQRLMGKNIENKSKGWEKSNSRYTEIVKETEMFASSARLYNTESNLWERFKVSANKMEVALMKLNFWQGFTNETISIIAYSAITIAPIAFGVYLVSQKNITLGTLIMISQLSNNFVNPVITISAYFNDLKVAKPMWEKFKKISNDSNYYSKSQSNLHDIKSIELKNVTVAYDDKVIFKNVSFNIKKGDKVLIVAPSGWGKSTLLNTLLGNMYIKSGKYLINGNDVVSNLSGVHNYFSYINQEPKLLNDTILYNITLGYPDYGNTLNSVIKKAGLEELVREKGLSFKVGISGSNLSGGQKQRIEIARALFFKRSVILADEATASLDPKLSKIIHDTLLKEYHGTLIEVAHHLTSEEKSMFNKVIDFNN